MTVDRVLTDFYCLEVKAIAAVKLFAKYSMHATYGGMRATYVVARSDLQHINTVN